MRDKMMPYVKKPYVKKQENTMKTLLFVSLLPPIYLLYRVYKMDLIEKEPMGLVFKLFVVGGFFSVVLAVLWEEAGAWLISELFEVDPDSDSADWFTAFIYNFFVIALAEETCKHFFLKRMSWKRPEFNYRFDGVVYAAAVSLGFAAVENIGYVFEYGMETGILRAVTSIPGHGIFGIFMGWYYGTARWAESHGEITTRKNYMALSILVPMLIHGFYDFILSVGSGWNVLIFLIYVILLYINAHKKLKSFQTQDGPVDPFVYVDDLDEEL